MPARLRDLVRVLRAMGIVVEEPNSGSHFKAVRKDTVYPIPAHNGMKTEIDDKYIRGMCRAFGLEFEDLKRLL